jgi:hypothetical protein
MTMKYLILSTLLLTSFVSNGQEVPFDHDKFVPSYKLIVPEGWTTEQFGIPIQFAPSIPYAGVEDVRFAPGWGNSTSEDYWSYSYLWFLKGKQDFKLKTIAEHLAAYYTGLIESNIERRKIPKEKVFPVKTTFEKVKTQPGDKSTFKGTVYMLDYMAQQPMTLNCLVHVKVCPGKENTFVFFEVSPRKEDHPIWNTLNGIWTEFQCDVKN